MTNVLDKIVATKQQEVAAGKLQFSVADFKQQITNQEQPRGFIKAISQRIDAGESAVIAEVKKASPSKGR